MLEDYMHIIYDQKQVRFWSGCMVSDFDSSTCQLRKMISQSFGPVGDSSAEWLVWNLTASIQFL